MTLTLDINQLSKEINLAIRTIRTTLVRNPTALPPRLVIPGQKRLLWLRSDVERFYESQVRVHGSNRNFTTNKKKLPEEIFCSAEKTKRGRPTKTQQIIRKMK